LILVLLFPLFQSSGGINIAIVNEKSYHLEIVAGFLHTLGQFANTTTLYLHGENRPHHSRDYGFLQMIAHWEGKLKFLPTIPRNLYLEKAYDVAVFISPEYNVEMVKTFLSKSKTKVAVLVVHNADQPTVLELPKVHHNAHVVTLSPHVQKTLKTRTGIDAVWMLPIFPVKPAFPCYIVNMRTCVSGFAIQGNFDSTRRNYTAIWEGMLNKLHDEKISADERFMINVIGNGNASSLNVPPNLKNRVHTHVGLGFVSFYDTIYHNLALLPSFASNAYVTTKFSSTVISSLITGAPLVSSTSMLTAYTFFNESTTILQRKEENITDVMARMTKMTPLEMKLLRENLNGLRTEINKRTLSILLEWFAPIPKEGGKEWTDFSYMESSGFHRSIL
jgi:hypothetical protein